MVPSLKVSASVLLPTHPVAVFSETPTLRPTISSLTSLLLKQSLSDAGRPLKILVSLKAAQAGAEFSLST